MAIHPKGDQRSQWVAGEKRSALLLLVSGRFRVELPERTVLLAEQGRLCRVPGYAAQDGQDTGGQPGKGRAAVRA